MNPQRQGFSYSVRTQLTFVSPEPNPDRATPGLGISSGPTSDNLIT